VINRLAQVLDPRGFSVRWSREPNEEQRMRPWMWRYWRALPGAGHFVIFDQSWYRRVLVERVEGKLSRREWERAYDDVLDFERQLADDGTLIVKFWLHITHREQRKRLERLEKNPATSWRVRKEEWDRNQHYDQWQEVVGEMLARTGTAHAPWHVVEATQGRFRRTKVFQTLVQTLQTEIGRRRQLPKPELRPMPEPQPSPLNGRTVLDRVDLSLSLSREDYKAQLDPLQDRLFELQNQLYRKRIPAVIVYQGWDAGGKGGNIKRLTRGLDPRGYEVIPVAAPNDEERSHHYLWRFWRELPKAGHVAIFDRSWYGRVLVERVEGFCSEDAWRRAYREINQLERQLADFGTVLVKFWLHIDREEQLRRFREREATPHKQWKITDEDWRNREKWDRYRAAVVDMLHQTSTPYAPWTVLEANCKLTARIKALRTVAAAWEAAI
jgi:AMP-polyphosphate phosphotransferase